MKKLVAVALSGLLMISFAGCTVKAGIGAPFKCAPGQVKKGGC